MKFICTQGLTPDGVAMPLQHCRELREILGGFQSIEIVRSLPDFDSRGAELFHPYVIAQADSSPVIALQHDQRTIKMKALDRKQIHAAAPELSRGPRYKVQH